MFEISKFDTAKFRMQVPSYEELLQLPYDELYKIHSAVTLQRVDTMGSKQLAFGDLTVDVKPNKNGEVALHFAPLRKSELDVTLNYKPPSLSDALKISLIGLEDILNLLKYYQNQDPQLRPQKLIGKTNSGMVSVATQLGFQEKMMSKEDSSHGVIRFITADTEKMIDQLQALQERYTELLRLAAKRRITPQLVRSEIITAISNS